MIHHMLSVITLGLIAGITEFIPVSSSAHTYLFSHFFHDLPVDPKIFSVLMQFCAICVVLLYRFKFWSSLLIGCLLGRQSDYHTMYKLFIAFVPICIVGFFVSHYVHQYLFSFSVIGLSLILGGVIMLMMERWLEHRRPHIRGLSELSYRDALIIGCVQIFALIPGVSRSATTIVSALVLGCSRPFAVLFSFFVAVPTLFSASIYELVKYRHMLVVASMPWYLLGAFVTCVSAFFSIHFFISYFSKHALYLVAFYRIFLGAMLMIFVVS